MKRLLLAVACLLVPTWATAQNVVNPHFVDFVASSDHSATKLDGTPVVTRYELTAMAVTLNGALVWTQDLAKPTPNAQGLITVAFPAVLPITPEALYTAKIAAIGPDGSSSSGASNPFGVAGTRIPAAAANVKVR